MLRLIIPAIVSVLTISAVPTSAHGGEDQDGDGFGLHEDCDDSDSSVYPGAPEGCDGLDTDCDGILAPQESDLDGDGFRLCEGFECDDTRAEVHAGAAELCDGLDTDCDGTIPPGEVDTDGDGWRLCAGDCDDEESERHPGAAERCDGLDNDCSGSTLETELDVDGDGLAPCEGDCDDDERGVRLGALEQCDDLDNNCDGFVDEGCTAPDEDDPPGSARGCTARGCGWSSPTLESMLPLVLLPGFGWGRRRAGRSRI